MAATSARSGFGTLFQIGDGAGPEVFTTIAEVRDISGPAIRQMVEDATHMESPDGYAEKVPTIREAGDVTFQMHLVAGNATQDLLRADLNAGTKRNFRIVVGGATKRWAFTGYVTEVGSSHPVKGVMVNDVTISLTGKPVLENNS